MYIWEWAYHLIKGDRGERGFVECLEQENITTCRQTLFGNYGNTSKNMVLTSPPLNPTSPENDVYGFESNKMNIDDEVTAKD